MEAAVARTGQASMEMQLAIQGRASIRPLSRRVAAIDPAGSTGQPARERENGASLQLDVEEEEEEARSGRFQAVTEM